MMADIKVDCRLCLWHKPFVTQDQRVADQVAQHHEESFGHQRRFNQ